ncbi:MAG: tRNA uridine-5-carboxymethylaminomethyl(34) synthesis enzyme MnmG [Bacillota bacterium]|nr:tRNA uridine-5-carboxymethylaminomethyl(34) synthesis enzyme MnmG [Bacillota bacterium]
MDDFFDIIVVGGGHAGVEASYASARKGHKTLLITLNRKMIANMPCNPHIGGSAKGVVVREIDALGGLMGIAADQHPLQMKMLNTGKGPGVQCLRSQQDKAAYPSYVQKVLEECPNLTIYEDEVKGLLHDESSVFGVCCGSGRRIQAKAVILTTGTYMDSSIIRGKEVTSAGPDGEKSSIGLSKELSEMGLKLVRLKTGTPPRLAKSSIDFSKGEIQLGSDEKLSFSFEGDSYTPLSKQLPCYLIYTNEQTHKIILDHLNESAIFDGTITGIGPRYCPSIESKIVRFADKPRHQLFLEPEYEEGESFYLQGFSTGMPREIQEEMVHSLPGLERAKILKYAYQIEYDAIDSLEFDASLKIKKYDGLYVAGQICCTSGYEEAAGLGLMAGINACNFIDGKPPFILRRDEAYIGVMIDDLVTKGTDEPYRLLSSRAEYRLLLRHDNADKRLTKYGFLNGLIRDQRYQHFEEKYSRIDSVVETLSKSVVTDRAGCGDYLRSLGYEPSEYGYHAYDLLKRPYVHLKELQKYFTDLSQLKLSNDEILSIEVSVKYSGYISREEKEAAALKRQEDTPLPIDVDYLKVSGLRLEARQKLNAVKPLTIGQASRIPGVNPADVSILLLTLRRDGKL